jgi:Uma2 family endonuclease
MRAAAKKLPQIISLEDERYNVEVIQGIRLMSPRPAPGYISASTKLGALLLLPFEWGQGGPGGWWILDEPELHLDGSDPIIPDHAGWRIERMASLPKTAYFKLPPDWVCEVLSPSTETIDRGMKMPVYARHRIRHVWLVSPKQRTIEVHRLVGKRYEQLAVHRAVRRLRLPPFDAVELPYNLVFRTTAPRKKR